jgi:hexosaminidase
MLVSEAPAAATVIPMPAAYVERAEIFRFGDARRIIYRGELAREAALALRTVLKERIAVNLPVERAESGTPVRGDIRVEIDENGQQFPSPRAHSKGAQESYHLEATKEGVILHAPSESGLFYGVQTFRQILDAAPRRVSKDHALTGLRIDDRPRFEWRGVLLDESRHFFGKKSVLDLLDLMAYLKLNRFHWHLTDESGWRIEIRKYPKLTEIGARGNHSDPDAPAAFYTQEDIREIVAYAQQRHIVIVPEIDMPGHASAATRAYPEISGGGEAPWEGFTFNPAREQTYQFLTDVLKEVTSLFPGPYLHLGGDEVHFGNQSWDTDPEIVAFTQAQGLEGAAGLERYFVRRMAAIIKGLGKTVMGWDEIGTSGVPSTDATVIWWRHDKPEVLDTLLQKGYPVVLSPRIPCYFDFVQDPTHNFGRRWDGRFNSLESVYGFPAPLSSRASIAGAPERIVGLEACLWSETIADRDRLWYLALPRLAAFAEAAWSPALVKDYTGFMLRLRRSFLNEAERRGLSFYNPFDPTHTPEPPGPGERKPLN